MLFVLIALRHFHKPLVRKFANDIVLIDTLENGIQFPNPLLYLRQTLFLLRQLTVSLPHIGIHIPVKR